MSDSRKGCSNRAKPILLFEYEQHFRFISISFHINICIRSFAAFIFHRAKLSAIAIFSYDSIQHNHVTFAIFAFARLACSLSVSNYYFFISRHCMDARCIVGDVNYSNFAHPSETITIKHVIFVVLKRFDFNERSSIKCSWQTVEAIMSEIYTFFARSHLHGNRLLAFNVMFKFHMHTFDTIFTIKDWNFLDVSLRIVITKLGLIILVKSRSFA